MARGKKRSSTPLMRLVTLLLKLLSAAAGLALLLTLIAPYISPRSIGLLPTLALIAPATYIINVLLMLYWVAVWQWRYALVLLAVISCCINRVPLFINYSPTQEYGEPSYRGMSKVVSYNIRALQGDDNNSSLNKIANFLNNSGGDIITLQELNAQDRSKLIAKMANLKGFNIVHNKGVSILSRYPIVKSGDPFSNYEIDSSDALWADLLVGGDTLRVVTLHLESTTIKASDQRYLTSRSIVTDDNRLHRVVDIVRRYQRSCIERAKQARVAAHFIKETPHPIVVTGDFNDTPASYAYNTVSRGLDDSFEECGNAYSYTYRGFFNMLRIDYILTGGRATPQSYLVDRTITASDHLPVVSHIKIDKR